jgi:hypothetical protein
MFGLVGDGEIQSDQPLYHLPAPVALCIAESLDA